MKALKILSMMCLIWLKSKTRKMKPLQTRISKVNKVIQAYTLQRLLRPSRKWYLMKKKEEEETGRLENILTATSTWKLNLQKTQFGPKSKWMKLRLRLTCSPQKFTSGTGIKRRDYQRGDEAPCDLYPYYMTYNRVIYE